MLSHDSAPVVGGEPSIEPNFSFGEVFAEGGVDMDERARTLNQVQEYFGDRVFTYGTYSGTVQEMERCPVFGEMLQQGFDAAVAWLLENDGKVGEETTDDSENTEDDAAESDKNPLDTPASEPAVKEAASDATQQKAHAEQEAARADALAAATSASEGTPATESGQQQVQKTGADTVAAGGDVQTSKQVKPQAKDVTDGIKAPSAKEVSGEVPALAIKEILPKSPVEVVAQDSSLTAELAAQEPVEYKAETGEPDTEPVTDSTNDIEARVTQQLDVAETIAVEPQLKTLDDLVDERHSEESYIEPADDTEFVLDKDIEQAGEESDTVIYFEQEFDDSPEIIQHTFGAEDAIENPTDEVVAMNEIEQVQNEQHRFTEINPDEMNEPGQVLPDVIESALVAETSADDSNDHEAAVAVIPAEIIQAEGAVETIQRFTQLIEQAPDDTVEYEIEQVRVAAEYAYARIEKLERAMTAEECREALEELKFDLERLLTMLGYANPDMVAKRLVAQFDVASLKAYMALLVRSLQEAGAFEPVVQRAAAQKAGTQKYGVHAVRTVINLITPTRGQRAA